jgi:hypothetical protein
MKSELDSIVLGEYTINSDKSIDVIGDILLFRCDLSEIPFNFNSVSGSFNVSKNKLRSLKGCPKFVGGDFSCRSNNLTDLTGGPIKVIGDYSCYYNNLTSLKGSPDFVGRDFYCDGLDIPGLIFNKGIITNYDDYIKNVIRSRKIKSIFK